ncbi:MAG: hypothetical protein Q4E31_04385 [Intestinibacter bartlettii]|uniref:hypothetical protein n=1 Tax=Intestinibacter bartlettii TaxID=261299 RepID=UPI0026EAC4FE|nr:hypothetical protein [Intestinibacter bartlettii]MDO5010042.1 hypothetical protein [Intestinibacter bartlettii]
MNKILKKIIDFIKGEIIIRTFIAFIILDIGGDLLMNFGFKVIYSKFSIVNLVLGIFGVILLIIFFILTYKNICLVVNDKK